MGRFERFLSLWVALAIAVGVLLGRLAPGAFAAVSRCEVAHINLLVAALIWLMIYPMMLAIEPRCIAAVGRRPKGLILTLVVNWLIKPFTMAALGALFFRVVFAGWLSEADASQYMAGLILLGVAPCTAMVFVWSQLTKGDAAYTLVQVTVNDLVMVVLFAPITAFLLGVSDVPVPWTTLLVSVLLFVVVPLLAGMLTRARLLAQGGELAVSRLAAALKPWSIAGLLLTVVLLFGFQAETLLTQPERVAMIAVPLLLQSYGIFALGYLAARWLRLDFAIAAPAALIGTSNFFELAVAVAIGLFGLQSGAALATVVGVLIEVPVMLSLVAFCNLGVWCEWSRRRAGQVIVSRGRSPAPRACWAALYRQALSSVDSHSAWSAPLPAVSTSRPSSSSKAMSCFRSRCRTAASNRSIQTPRPASCPALQPAHKASLFGPRQQALVK